MTEPGANARSRGGDQGWILEARNLFLRRFVFPMLRGGKGEKVLDHAWDNLIILDDCRFDAFAEAYRRFGLEGEFRAYTSLGTDTGSFLTENFAGAFHDDIVYITGNPRVNMLVQKNFHRIVPVWKDGWDARANTVLPKTMREQALSAANQYPNKRLIIHFIQPHIPFIDLPEGVSTSMGVFPELKRRMINVGTRISQPSIKRPPFGIYIPPWNTEWYRFEISLGDEKIWELYKLNLARALEEVRILVGELRGKTVVTADHGEAIGDKLNPLLPFRVYGHPPGVRMKCLTQVPWLIHESSERKIPSPGAPASSGSSGDSDDKIVEERLKSLGYI